MWSSVAGLVQVQNMAWRTPGEVWESSGVRKVPACGCCVGFISGKLSREVTILMILGARFPLSEKVVKNMVWKKMKSVKLL